MRPSFCRSCLASLLKLLNFFQTFVGIAIVLYGAWILSHLKKGNLGSEFSFDFDKLPAPWFVCAVMGIGILLCLIAFTGHVAAEAISGCCLSFYAILTMILILLEAALLGEVVFNKCWEENLPYDSTGQLNRLRAFIEGNIDVCQWVAVAIIVIQVLSLLLAITLRGMLPRRLDYGSDEDFVVIRRPLLNHQGGLTYTPTMAESGGHHSDIWSSWMRQKYGSNQN